MTIFIDYSTKGVLKFSNVIGLSLTEGDGLRVWYTQVVDDYQVESLCVFNRDRVNGFWTEKE